MLQPGNMTIQQQNERIRLSMFKLLCLGLGLGALAWTVLCVAFGLYRCAAIPLGFVVITLLNLALCRLSGRMAWCMRVQVLFSLLLPFLFQAVLGGSVASGMVMFWSFVALAGALTFQSRVIAIGWVALEVTIVLAFTLFDPVIDLGDPLGAITQETRRWFLSFNVASVTVLLFSLALQFVRVQGRMRKRLHEVRQELEAANTVLSTQRSDTLNGLRYARQIQSALLPDLGAHTELFSKVHVLDRPRDTVGGDSYWCGGHGDHRFLVIMDCTGHGMPGALLSMLCHGILNELVYKDRIDKGSELIRRTQIALDRLLKRDNSGRKDGAEMAVVHFDRRERRAYFSGLGCSVIHSMGTHVTVLRGQRPLPTMMNGWNGLEDIDLELGSTSRLHLFTDGVVDQFDAEQRLKFSLKRLVDLVCTHAATPLEKAELGIVEALSDWRKEGDQIDDMLMLAVEPDVRWHRIPVVEEAEAA